MAKHSKKPITSGTKAAIIISGIILVLGIAAVLVVFGLLYVVPATASDVNIGDGGRPTYATLDGMTALMNNANYTAALNKIKADEHVDDAVLKELALKFLDVAAEGRYLNKEEDFFEFTVADGGGDASFGDIYGAMTIRGFSLNIGGNTYAQSGGPVSGANNPVLLGGAQLILNQLHRTATLNGGRDYIQQKGSGKAEVGTPDIEMEEFPYLGTDYSKLTAYKYSIDQWMLKDNLNALYTMTTFDLEASALKGSDTTSEDVDGNEVPDLYITYDSEGHFWTIHFSVKCPDFDGSPKDNGYNNYTEYAKALLGPAGYQEYERVVSFSREGVRESASAEDLEYNRYDVTMEIWDEGYVKTWTTDESWAATMVIASIELAAATSSHYSYTYFYEESEMLEEISSNTSDEYAEIIATGEEDPYQAARDFYAYLTGATYTEGTKEYDGTWTAGGWTGTATTDLKGSDEVKFPNGDDHFGYTALEDYE